MYRGLVLRASSTYSVATDRICSALTLRGNVGLSSSKLEGGIIVDCAISYLLCEIRGSPGGNRLLAHDAM